LYTISQDFAAIIFKNKIDIFLKKEHWEWVKKYRVLTS